MLLSLSPHHTTSLMPVLPPAATFAPTTPVPPAPIRIRNARHRDPLLGRPPPGFDSARNIT